MPQSVTTADYVAMIVVIVPCLFFMCLIPLIVNFREERRPRQHLAAPVVEDRPMVEDRRLPQAGEEEEEDAARDPVGVQQHRLPAQRRDRAHV
jgi:hypothetical protein